MKIFHSFIFVVCHTPTLESSEPLSNTSPCTVCDKKIGTVEAHALVFIMMPKNKQKTMLLVVTVLFALSLDSVCWAFSPVQPSLSSITSPSLSLSSSLNTPSFFTQPKELSSIRTLQALAATTRLQASASGNDDERQGLKIIIAGAPASGKGTQCENIKKHYAYR